MICQVFVVSERIKTMHFSEYTFQVQKLLPQIRKLLLLLL